MKQNKELNITTINITLQIPKGEHCANNGPSCRQRRGITCLAFNEDLTWDNGYKHLKKCLSCLTASGSLIQEKRTPSKKQGVK